MVEIRYEYRGLKVTPNKWFNGVVIEYRHELCWCEGSEKVDSSKANERVEELKKIVDVDGKKKYRNINVLF